MQSIRGQTSACRLLQTALDTGRVHHAYIFHGPTGVGKFTTAKAFANTILCKNPVSSLTGEIQPCGQCEACLAADNHPDLHVVTKELARFSQDGNIRKRKLTTIPVQVLREALLEPVQLRSTFQHGKVFIVDEAQLLNAEGQNLLLKTLEEPPADTHIILVTASEDRLLPTVRSRCQRVAFGRLSDQDVDDWLGQQQQSLHADDRAWVIAFAQGSLGRAALILDYDLLAWSQSIDPGLAQLAAGEYPTNLGGQLREAIETFAQSWVDKHDKETTSKDAANRLGCALAWTRITQWAQHHLHDAARQCDPQDPQDAEQRLGPWVSAVQAVRLAETQLASNVNMGLICEHLVSVLHRAMHSEPSPCLAW